MSNVETTKGIFNCLTLQKQFMEAAGQVTDGSSCEVFELYKKLVDEEIEEFNQAETKLEKVKEACDVIVVCSGFIISKCSWEIDYSADFISEDAVTYLCDELGMEKAQKAYELVHASNMEKLVGKVERREDGKILKDKSWSENIKIKLMSDISLLLD